MSAHEKKIGELVRFTEFLRDEGMSYEQFAAMADVSVRTVSNTVHENKYLGASIMRGILKTSSVSLDWIITGEGEKYRVNARPIISYSGNGIAVHQNHGSIGVGEALRDSAGRGSRMCQWIRHYMDTHTADECAWLEVEMGKHFPEFLYWKKGRVSDGDG